MSETHTALAADLEEMLEEDIPCGGNAAPISRTCTQPAMLMSLGHGCLDHIAFKCVACWQVWYKYAADFLQEFRHVDCVICDRRFYTVDSLSDYRPF